ncbi:MULTISPECIES: hypothetical protein [Streptosporangium]|uniref:MinD-like ATPase involved in chromosome partitioning or flagellar assembly n=1 Tax=Streptosporangium brasiliense TaxID=47480 RepID=A0ABT9QZD9_9ACTN|nr:hypothetical protein [Streptosporangium brasiliense]MDP9862322.1 MinD-like ATPase involved in chromosome partitioning or flagellar assembly [Streptosporangium brasiliense]
MPHGGTREGPAIDARSGRLFTENVREHLEQGVLVSRGEQGSGAEQAVKELAGSLEKARIAQLDG